MFFFVVLWWFFVVICIFVLLVLFVVVVVLVFVEDCLIDVFFVLLDVRIILVIIGVILVLYCKLYGVVGMEINFELFFLEVWNGKFVMGGGGGFVGLVVNGVMDFVDVLVWGWVMVGMDMGY